jgi:hypothetical protein
MPAVATPEGHVDGPKAAPAFGAKSLAACIVVAVVVNLWATRGQTFFSDEWGRLLLLGDSTDSLLRGYSGHLVVLHSLLYKGVFATFGIDTYLPFRIIEALLVGACGWLFYCVARARSGPWSSLAATLVLLFLGSAYEVTATPYGIVVLLPMAFGLGALACLERLPHRWDPLACGLLVAAVGSQSLGLAFVAGAAVVLVLQSGRHALARSWVVLVPGLLYVAWYGWSRLVTSAQPLDDPIRLHNLAQVPSTIVSVGAAGLSAVAGVFGASGVGEDAPYNLSAGYVLLGLLVIAVAWRVRNGPRLEREIWVPIALALTFWGLVGMAASPDRPPEASRYLYPSAAFLLLFVLELARGTRATPGIVLVAAGALAVSLIPNLVNLKQQADRIRASAASERAELASLELLRGEIPPASLPAVTIDAGVLHVGDGFPAISSSRYFAAIDRYGSPALSQGQLATASEGQRQAADRVLLDAGDLSALRAPARLASRAEGCRAARAGPGGVESTFQVPPAGLVVEALGSASAVSVAARRFGAAYQSLDLPAGAGALLLRPGAGQGGRPWSVLVSGARVCRAR